MVSMASWCKWYAGRGIDFRNILWYLFAGLAFGRIESLRNINFDIDNCYYRENSNEGSFIGLVKMLAAENADLNQNHHLQKCKAVQDQGRQNQLTMLSKRFIDKCLIVIHKHLIDKIVREINESGGQYGVMMDGTTDITTTHQVSIVVWYLNRLNKIVERTIGICSVNETTGESLYESLSSKLKEVGLQLGNIIGCSFDGAANMRGEFRGCKFADKN